MVGSRVSKEKELGRLIEERERLIDEYQYHSTEYLLQIWVENNTDKWSEMTIDTIGSILKAREVELPPQQKYIPPVDSFWKTEAESFWGGAIGVVKWIGFRMVLMIPVGAILWLFYECSNASGLLPTAPKQPSSNLSNNSSSHPQNLPGE